MAFRGGTTIQPSLGRLDFSGFEDAAMIDAESMVRIGASIAGAAKNYQKKKEEKEAQESFINIIEGFSEADNAVVWVAQLSPDSKLPVPSLVLLLSPYNTVLVVGLVVKTSL